MKNKFDEVVAELYEQSTASEGINEVFYKKAKELLTESDLDNLKMKALIEKLLSKMMKQKLAKEGISAEVIVSLAGLKIGESSYFEKAFRLTFPKVCELMLYVIIAPNSDDLSPNFLFKNETI